MKTCMQAIYNFPEKLIKPGVSKKAFFIKHKSILLLSVQFITIIKRLIRCQARLGKQWHKNKMLRLVTPFFAPLWFQIRRWIGFQKQVPEVCITFLRRSSRNSTSIGSRSSRFES